MNNINAWINGRWTIPALSGLLILASFTASKGYGAATAGQVVVTDARGVVATATLNAAGNFYSATKLTPPLRAKVVIGGKERVMKDPADSGDCNSCHTATGKNDAEGRIIGP